MPEESREDEAPPILRSTPPPVVFDRDAPPTFPAHGALRAPEPAPKIGSPVWGVLALGAGWIVEVLTHPILPWLYIPGTLFVSIGVGILVAIGGRKFPRYSTPAMCVIVPIIYAVAFFEGASPLPIFLCMAAFYLSDWAMQITL